MDLEKICERLGVLNSWVKRCDTWWLENPMLDLEKMARLMVEAGARLATITAFPIRESELRLLYHGEVLDEVHRMPYPACPECGRPTAPVREALIAALLNEATPEASRRIQLCQRCRQRDAQRRLASPSSHLAGGTASALPDGEFRMIYHWDLQGRLLNFVTVTRQASLASIAHICPAADWIEREIHDYFAVNFAGRELPPLVLNRQDPPGIFSWNFQWKGKEGGRE